MTTTKATSGFPEVLADWLATNGFENTARSGGLPRFDRDNIRVCGAIDEVVVVAFTGRPGLWALQWEVRFPAPEGRLSVPFEVLTAAVRAALGRRW